MDLKKLYVYSLGIAQYIAPKLYHRGHSSTLQRYWNKLMHIQNGNRNSRFFKDTTSVIQINTGNGKMKKNDNLLRDTIDKTKAKIILLSESNHDPKDSEEEARHRLTFPEFKFEHKILPGAKYARSSIMIHDSIPYTQCYNLENNINSCLVIKIERSRNLSIYVAATYRQWRGVSSECRFNKYDNDHQILRLQALINLWKYLLSQGQMLLIGGDVNIDRHLPNNPLGRAELKDLIPMFQDFLDEENVSQLNWEPTRFLFRDKP